MSKEKCVIVTLKASAGLTSIELSASSGGIDVEDTTGFGLFCENFHKALMRALAQNTSGGNSPFQVCNGR
jgi:hypothetical protein